MSTKISNSYAENAFEISNGPIEALHMLEANNAQGESTSSLGSYLSSHPDNSSDQQE